MCLPSKLRRSETEIPNGKVRAPEPKVLPRRPNSEAWWGGGGGLPGTFGFRAPRPPLARGAVATATAPAAEPCSPSHPAPLPYVALLRGSPRTAPAPGWPQRRRGLVHLHFCLRGPLGVDQQVIENRLLLSLRSGWIHSRRRLGGRHVRPAAEQPKRGHYGISQRTNFPGRCRFGFTGRRCG